MPTSVWGTIMSKTYCAKLWDHQYIHMSGSLRYCCATMDNILDAKGNTMHLNNTSLDQAWNSKTVRETRLKMLKGEDVAACSKCVDQEQRGYKSMRVVDNMEKNFSLTKEDGSIDVFPNDMELHLGNLCNLKCKMCGQQYSNQVGKEILEIGKDDPDFLKWVTKESGNVNIWTNNLSVEYRWFQNQKTKNKLFEYIGKNITNLGVIGGEPTVIPQFWELFEYLDDRKLLGKMSMTINTNLTNVNPKLTKWLPKLKRWNIWASVDGVGERTEYIRYPSSWNKVNENLNFYKELSGDNGHITLSPAIQLLNIDQLDEILIWWLNFCDGEFSKKHYISWMAQVWYPTICNYDIAPKSYKIMVANKLKQSLPIIGKYKQLIDFYQVQIDNLSKDVCNFKDRKYFQKAFIRYNDKQDQHRNKTSWRQLLPELSQALTESLS